MIRKILTGLFVCIALGGFSQLTTDQQLSKIRSIGFQQSAAKKMFHELTDLYGQRLTGSREYYEAAKWAAATMKEI
jgi:hypothetical protein